MTARLKSFRIALLFFLGLGFINFCHSQIFIDLDGKRIATVKGNNPYMTSKVLFGDVTQLTAGQQIEIIGFEQDKVKIVSNGIIGFIRQDFISLSDVTIAKELQKKLLVVAGESKKRKVDSLSRMHDDSVLSRPEMGFTDYSALKVLHLLSQRVGYIYWSSLDLSTNLKDSINHGLKRTSEAEDKANTKALAENLKKRKADLVKRFGVINAERLTAGKIWIGMTSEMARIDLGSPEKNNRTVTASSVSE